MSNNAQIGQHNDFDFTQNHQPDSLTYTFNESQAILDSVVSNITALNGKTPEFNAQIGQHNDFDFTQDHQPASLTYTFNESQVILDDISADITAFNGKVPEFNAQIGQHNDFDFTQNHQPTSLTYTFNESQAILDDVTGIFNAEFTTNIIAREGVLSGLLESINSNIVAQTNTPSEGILLGLLEDIITDFKAGLYYEGVVLDELDSITSNYVGEYDSNVVRLTVSTICSPIEETEYLVGEICDEINNTTSIDIKICSVQEQATFLDVETCAPVDNLPTESVIVCSPLDMTIDRTDGKTLILQDTTFSHQIETCSSVDDARDAKQEKVCAPIRTIYSHQIKTCMDHEDTKPLSMETCAPIEIIEYQSNKTCAIIEETCPLAPGESEWVDFPIPPYEDPPGHQITIIPEQEAYCMKHIITVTLTDLTTVIPLNDINLSHDSDSMVWSWTATLTDKSVQSLIEPVNGQPVTLVITINGEEWRVLVEKISTTQSFESNSVSLSGRGVVALLTDPYVLTNSVTQGSTLTNQQIADLLMPIGWTVDWQLPTWLVPGGTYTHTQKTPLQAVFEIAQNCGGMLVPDRTLQILHVIPRYNVLPWDFALATEDVTIPMTAVENVTKAVPTRALYNGVYVHGIETGGRIGFARHNGTAGDVLAPTTSNRFMTDVVGTRALAERVLAAYSEQPEIESISMPFDGATFPLIELGQLINVGGVKGIVNSISINASFGHVRQSVQIGEQSSNPWTQFTDLLPKDPLLIATLASTNNNTSLMTMLDGGTINVMGAGTPGLNYYISSGRLQGEAPQMPQDLIVIG